MGFSSDKPIVLTWQRVPRARRGGQQVPLYTLTQNRIFTEGWQAFTDAIQGTVLLAREDDGAALVSDATRSAHDQKVHLMTFHEEPTMKDISRIEQFIQNACKGFRTAFEFDRKLITLQAAIKTPPLIGLEKIKGIAVAVDVQLNGGYLNYKEAYEQLKKAIEAE
jgi:hypothetical protein